jgi:hypothetical protein
MYNEKTHLKEQLRIIELLENGNETLTDPDTGLTAKRYTFVSAATELTRPSNISAYVAKDTVNETVASYLTFANVVTTAGDGGYIMKARLVTNNVLTVAIRFKLHLYHTAPTPIADRTQFTLLYANRANRIGSITFPATSTEGTGSDSANTMDDAIRLAFTTVGATSLYGVLEAVDAFTPTSGQKFYVELTVDKNKA